MSRNNTGNPLGSKAFLDFEDNVKNLDQAVNAEQDTFQDRLGKSRLTWTGIVKAGTGDAGVIVPIVQQAVQDVVAGVDGQVAVAQSAADRAEVAADVATNTKSIFQTPGDGQASSELTAGDYFWVESAQPNGGLELWRKGTSSPTDTGRRSTTPAAVRAAEDLTLVGVYSPPFMQGTIAGSGPGLELPATNRLRIARHKTPFAGKVSLKTSPGQQARVVLFNPAGNFQSWTEYGVEITDIEVDGFFNVLVKWEDDRDILPSQNTAEIKVSPSNSHAEELVAGVVEELKDYILLGKYTTAFESGTLALLSNPPGQKTQAANRLRIARHKTPLRGYLTVRTASDQQARIVLFDPEGNFQSWTDYGVELVDVEVDGFFNVLVRWDDDSNIDPSENTAEMYLSPVSKNNPEPEPDVSQEWLRDIPLFSNTNLGSSIYLPLSEKQALFQSILESYPASVTSEKIGESFDGAHDIMAYTVTPDSYTVTIAITCHTHGDEKLNPSGFFALLDAVAKPGPKHEFLQWLRGNVRWVIVPFVSPAGYVANTRATNGINLNRNFDYRWALSSDTDKGVAPNSAPEAQALVGFFTPIRDEIDYHMDLHDIPRSYDSAYKPFQNTHFLWKAEQDAVRDYLAKVNQATPGGNYFGQFGTVTNFFNANLGIPSITPEHVVNWWGDKDIAADQQVAKAAEQTAGFLQLFRHKFEDRRGSAFYSRLFERSFGSIQYGYSGWSAGDIANAFSALDGVESSSAVPGAFEKTGVPGAETILVISGIQSDDNHSALTVLRCFERIIAGQEMYVAHLQRCNFVIVPILNPTDEAETALQSDVESLITQFQPDYTIAVRAPKLTGSVSPSTVRIGLEGEETQKTKESGLMITTNKVGIENYLSTPYSVFDLRNQVSSAGLYSHCVAEWVKYVLNDMASFYIS